MKLSEMKKGDRSKFNLLVKGIEEREAKNKSAFCVLTLCNKEEQIAAKIWNNAKKDIKSLEGKVIEADLSAKEFNGVIDYELNHYAVTELPIEDFIKSAPFDREKAFNIMIDTLNKYNTSSYVLLAISILNENKEKFIKWGAAKANHHNYLGGLVWHTARMVNDAVYLGKMYHCDLGLLLAATALHDIGKIDELETSPIGDSEYTPTGTMLGHAYLGMRRIEKKAQELFKGKKSEEEITAAVEPLLHCIAAHHGNLEWEAIKVPCIMEAQLLHFIDMIDSRMEVYEEELSKIDKGEMSKSKVFMLGTSVYNPPEFHI